MKSVAFLLVLWAVAAFADLRGSQSTRTSPVKKVTSTKKATAGKGLKSHLNATSTTVTSARIGDSSAATNSTSKVSIGKKTTSSTGKQTISKAKGSTGRAQKGSTAKSVNSTALEKQTSKGKDSGAKVNTTEVNPSARIGGASFSSKAAVNTTVAKGAKPAKKPASSGKGSTAKGDRFRR